MKYDFFLSTETAMQRLGAKVAACTPQGTAIALRGPLGSGKSVFARGFIRHFGIKEHILSPTFTLVQQYSTFDFDIYHFDLYRLSSAEEFELIGGRECLSSPGFCLIEWPEIIADELDKRTSVFIDISILSDGSRKVFIDAQFEIK